VKRLTVFGRAAPCRLAPDRQTRIVKVRAQAPVAQWIEQRISNSKRPFCRVWQAVASGCRLLVVNCKPLHRVSVGGAVWPDFRPQVYKNLYKTGRGQGGGG